MQQACDGALGYVEALVFDLLPEHLGVVAVGHIPQPHAHRARRLRDDAEPLWADCNSTADRVTVAAHDLPARVRSPCRDNAPQAIELRCLRQSCQFYLDTKRKPGFPAASVAATCGFTDVGGGDRLRLRLPLPLLLPEDDEPPP
eukprot:CAMPEP_0170632090 /NCGR_PEP_ID=MMETSP0224-20130122/35068_1 /TAXON_ID=285029 /ORGANISM="Togula jolla, Strain CCCM 725" /LENGTH=143 /DNA_ID=CAMNT_0010960631 /DNA_START=100 /DNA_END=532 /DNA_ORIENTATION=+